MLNDRILLMVSRLEFSAQVSEPMAAGEKTCDPVEFNPEYHQNKCKAWRERPPAFPLILAN